MLAVARAVVSGWWQGPLLAAICFQLPLLNWLSMAILALVSLRGGFLAATATLLAMSVSSWLVMSQSAQLGLPLLGVLSALVLVITAEVLRTTRRIEWAWAVAAIVTVLGFLILLVAVPDALNQYRDVLDKFIAMWLQSLSGPEATELKASVAAQAELTEAFLVQMLAVQVMMSVGIGLTLGRYWQAALFNPGGFGKEIKSFRLEPSLAILLLGLWLGAQAGSAWISGLAQVLWIPFLIGGIGCFHWFAAERKLPGFSYLVFYLVVLVIQIVVVMFAVVDSFFDIRKRLVNG